MIGLDTNIVVRLITQDDPAQTRIAKRILERQLSAAEPGYVSLAVVLETVWVLESGYGYGAADIAAALKDLLAQEVLVIEAEQEVLAAAVAAEEGTAPLVDALIAALGRAAGCSVTLTFDKKASRLPGFQMAK